ncbi:MAG: ATP-binding protein [Candidatus Pacebacteria bacterium]|nr:ATP-binding protein [Candidatus Paceibacterota bacterium]
MLITRIKVKNFYGIKDAVEVKFIEGGKIDKSGYFKIASNQRVSLINGFYGANASGKSTILNAMDKIIDLMLVKRPDFSVSPIGIQQETIICLPNYHVDAVKDPTELEIDFISGNNKYAYKICIINGRIIGREVFFRNGVRIFDRNKDSIVFPEKKYKQLGNTFKDYVLPKKSSFLSALLDGRIVSKDLEAVVGLNDIKAIRKKTCFITDKRAVALGQNNIGGLFAVFFNYINNADLNKENYLNNINSIAKYFEPSLDKIVIKQKKSIDPNNIEADYGIKYKNCDKLLPITEASAGTRELIAYINNILDILKSGGVIVYDETSKYYHPDMEIAILNLFRDGDVNKNHAQIFFSSHNHATFDLLHNSQAHIMEKENDAITVNKVLDYDVKERDNIKKKYKAGSLGGVPDTIDFNRIINNLL